jgi:tetratricopeptide (TPR) repeat protein
MRRGWRLAAWRTELPATVRAASLAAAPAPQARVGPRERIAAARAALARGAAAEARAAARDALAWARAGDADALLMGEACLYEAIASNLLQDPVAGYERALEAEALLPADAHALRVRALNTCFVACAQTGHLGRALDHFRDAMEVARRGGDRAGAARLLHNRGSLLHRLGENGEAVRCLEEALAAFESLPQGQEHLPFTRINLASACMDLAAQLAAQGQAALAAAQRRRAAQLLPAMDLEDRAPVQPDELMILHTWVGVQAELGRLAQARRGARRYLWLRRRAGNARRYQIHAWLALAAYHEQAGQVDRAIRRQQAAIVRLLDAGGDFEAVDAQHRLGRMHARCGQHAQALACLRRAQAERLRLQAGQAVQRCRLAALEREVQRRRAALQESGAHAQRLAVVGRLMSDIHHALAVPIGLAHVTLGRCAQATRPTRLVRALQRVVAQVDQAAGLARQLKMFSYRAAPQAMVVELHDSLCEAWDGVALWRRGSARTLQISGDLAAVARVDAQRLAVLLRILLIEADQALPTMLAVHLGHDPPHSRMELQARTERAAWVGDPEAAAVQAAGAAKGAGDSGAGLTLCQEIAQEMGGRLTGIATAGGPGFVLELPDA